MPTVLIIYPHWHPSNLAGVHRARLLSNFLHEFGWKSVVLTVEASYYEEPPDNDIHQTFSSFVEVHRVKAFRRIGFVGDIGIRAFVQLYKGALKIIDSQKIDFIYIPVPSFYTSLLGRLLYHKRRVRYGIDYIDPWVRALAHYQKRFSKAWWSVQVAKFFEPIAVKHASLISGVAQAYYQPVLDRNFKHRHIEHVAMPYGFDANDHAIVLNNITFPWSAIPNCKAWIYAGAFLPKSHVFVDVLMKSISILQQQGRWDNDVHLFFIGTGNYAGETIADYARKYKVDTTVHEIHQRFPFLHVLNFLSAAQAVMVIGSTEKHYTASKTFQSLLSKRPVLAMLHNESSAVTTLKHCLADQFLIQYSETSSQHELVEKTTDTLYRIQREGASWQPRLEQLEQYSARESARVLAQKLTLIVQA